MKWFVNINDLEPWREHPLLWKSTDGVFYVRAHFEVNDIRIVYPDGSMSDTLFHTVESVLIGNDQRWLVTLLEELPCGVYYLGIWDDTGDNAVYSEWLNVIAFDVNELGTDYADPLHLPYRFRRQSQEETEVLMAEEGKIPPFQIRSNLAPQAIPIALSRYFMDEGSGATVEDANDRKDGTLFNSVTWVAGYKGLALQFNGVNQYGTFASTGWFANIGITTVFIRAKIPKTGTLTYLLAHPQTANNNRAYIYRDTSNRLVAVVGSTASIFAQSADYDANAWTEIVFVRSGAFSRCKAYLNGVLKLDTAVVIGTKTAEATVVLGAISASSGNFDGQIDQMVVFDGDVTPAQVADWSACNADIYLVSEDTGVQTLVSGKAIRDVVDGVFYYSHNGSDHAGLTCGRWRLRVLCGSEEFWSIPFEVTEQVFDDDTVLVTMEDDALLETIDEDDIYAIKPF